MGALKPKLSITRGRNRSSEVTMSDFDPDRRKVLMAGGTALTIALAGCSGDDDDGVDDDVPSDVADGLSDANGFDGSIDDHTGEDSVTVLNGVDGPDFAYDPAAIRVDAGTTVTWEWVGTDSHTVTHQGGDFESGLVSGEGETFEYTFEETGNYLYECDPHVSIGQIGAVVVE